MKNIKNLKLRRVLATILVLAGVTGWLIVNPESYEKIFTRVEDADTMAVAVTMAEEGETLVAEVLERLEVKGRAPKTGYSRDEFYNTWPTVEGCSLRQRIIRRELGETAVLDGCNVIAGEYEEPYTGEWRVFETREDVTKIQIDHVVALSDAWQKGAQYLSYEVRHEIATDPLNLLAVDGKANQQKSDGDAAAWLPPNKKFRCQYVARQVSVKYKYGLWVTSAEKETISGVLANCPREPAVGVVITDTESEDLSE